MGIFGKIFKTIAKPFKAVGKFIKKGWKKLGKFMNSLGIFGQIGMMMISGAISSFAFSQLGALASGGISKLTNVAATATGAKGMAAKTILGAVNTVRGAADLAKKGYDATLGSLTEGVVNSVGSSLNYIRNKSPIFKRAMAKGPATLSELGESYKNVWKEAGANAVEAARSIPSSIADVGRQANPFSASKIDLSTVTTPDGKQFHFDANFGPDRAAKQSLLERKGGTFIGKDGTIETVVPPEKSGIFSKKKGIRAESGATVYPLKDSPEVSLTDFDSQVPIAGAPALGASQDIRNIGLKDKMISYMPDAKETVESYLQGTLQTSLLGGPEQREVAFSGFNTATMPNPNIAMLASAQSNIGDVGVDLTTLGEQRYGEGTMGFPIELAAGADLLNLETLNSGNFDGGYAGANARWT